MRLVTEKNRVCEMKVKTIYWKLSVFGWKRYLKRLLIISLIFYAVCLLIMLGMFHGEEELWVIVLGSLVPAGTLFAVPALLYGMGNLYNYIQLLAELRYLHISSGTEITVKLSELTDVLTSGMAWCNREWFISGLGMIGEKSAVVHIIHRDYADCIVAEYQEAAARRSEGGYYAEIRMKSGKKRRIKFQDVRQRDNFVKWVRKAK